MRTLIIVVLFILVACKRDHMQKQISTDQLNAVLKMENSYQLAKKYNDSLMYATNGTIPNSNTTMIHYFDNMYHQYDSEFESCHNQYEHDYSSANHSHNSMGNVEMHGGGNGMMNNCQCCSNGGHSADIHQKMDGLRNLHAAYHH